MRAVARRRLVLLMLALLATVAGWERGEVRPSSSSTTWGLIGNDGEHLAEERAAGIGVKVVRLSWRTSFPEEGAPSSTYFEGKRSEIAELRRYGFAVVVDIGLQDTPAWVHRNYADSYYVNQLGVPYTGDGGVDMGDANLVFNLALRSAAAEYLWQLFHEIGTDFFGVRLGGGRYGELTYPPAEYGDSPNNYWAFDGNARSTSPTPGWAPGQPSPGGEAASFLDWYLDQLVAYQSWQIAVVRQSYHGEIMMLYPSWGIRPGQIDAALAENLAGTTSAEINGEIQRGFDFARQVGAIADPGVILTTTWLDAAAAGDAEADPRLWSPVRYLASLAAAHPLGLRLYGENTGSGSASAMRFSATQMRTYGLIGMAWYHERELFSGRYATLDDYRELIRSVSTRRAPGAADSGLGGWSGELGSQPRSIR